MTVEIIYCIQTEKRKKRSAVLAKKPVLVVCAIGREYSYIVFRNQKKGIFRKRTIWEIMKSENCHQEILIRYDLNQRWKT